MIKRNGVQIGVQVMNARTKGVSSAKETIEICENKHYISLNGKVVDISKEIDHSVDHTTYYPDDFKFDFVEGNPTAAAALTVTNETTSQAAIRLAASGLTDIVALNFASARNVGGGFLSGAVAQEEDLCRASALYPCLKTKPLFYNANVLCDNSYYTDGIIYSHKVPFFKDEYNLFIEEPYTLSIISAPAPNLNGSQFIDEDVLITKILHRTERILQVAHLNEHKNVILGAWGCGAFGNDPSIVANAFMMALEVVPAFDNVCFAVYDTRTPPHIYDTFKKVISNE
jgi:uncharacterized protein (TIGR02452 family)